MPVHIKLTALGERNFNCFHANSLAVIRPNVKPHARCKVESIAILVAAKEPSSTDSQVMKPVVLHRGPNHGLRCFRKIVPDRGRVSPRHDEQLVSLKLCLGHGIELARVRRGVAELERTEDRFDAGN